MNAGGPVNRQINSMVSTVIEHGEHVTAKPSNSQTAWLARLMRMASVKAKPDNNQNSMVSTVNAHGECKGKT